MCRNSGLLPLCGSRRDLPLAKSSSYSRPWYHRVVAVDVVGRGRPSSAPSCAMAPRGGADGC
eukprot:4206702-Lingulodinium_polyedra.AAC.1